MNETTAKHVSLCLEKFKAGELCEKEIVEICSRHFSRYISELIDELARRISEDEARIINKLAVAFALHNRSDLTVSKAQVSEQFCKALEDISADFSDGMIFVHECAGKISVCAP